jgi:hypothetical protein
MFSERLLLLGLALPFVRAFSAGTSMAHPPCGGPPPSVRSSHLWMAHHAPPHLLLAEKLLAGMQRALEDRRRVDELVAHFEYAGVVTVPAEGQQYEGQGAVKRFLTTLLVDNTVCSAHVDATGAVVASLSDGTGRPRELHLRPASRGTVVTDATLISDLTVHEELCDKITLGGNNAPMFASGPATFDGGYAGPKWETYDGRVRQRIWQVIGPSRRARMRSFMASDVLLPILLAAA